MWKLFLAALACFVFVTSALSQTADDYEEVVFTMRHKSLGTSYLQCAYNYRDNKVYLPLIELFSIFEIPVKFHTDSNLISGIFLPTQTAFLINLNTSTYNSGRASGYFNKDNIILAQADLYIDPDLLESLFGLIFKINELDLHIQFSTRHTLPVEERLNREKSRLGMTPFSNTRINYPLLYGRERSLLHGGFLDYAVSTEITKNMSHFSYLLSAGLEIMGGEATGTLHGYKNTNGSGSLNVSNLKWRYALSPNPYLTTISIGQLNSSGLWQQPFRGISLTNNPIEPRVMDDLQLLDGKTEPGSEVELHINDRLFAYVIADEVGYYAFEVPLTYGSANIKLRIYSPSGKIQTVTRRIQVPYYFLPAKSLAYDLQAGKPDPFFDTLNEDDYFGHGSLGYGITNWLTARLGAQYSGTDFDADNIFVYSSLSARVAKQIILNAELAPDAFYRLNAGIVLPDFKSFQLRYVNYASGGFFNSRNALEEWYAGVYLPFNHYGIRSGLRLGLESVNFGSHSSSMINTEINTRIRSFSLQLAYRDYFNRHNEYLLSGNGQLGTTIGYHFNRTSKLSPILNNLSLRGRANYSLNRNAIDQVDLQISKQVWQRGRIFMNTSYFTQSNQYQLQAGFSIDLNAVRSNTMLTHGRAGTAFRQQFSGSVALDIPNKSINLMNRSMVGRSGAAFVLFADNNNSGTYDEGDELLPYNAVRLDRMSRTKTGKDGILRASMLQSFFQYNVSINRHAIPNPSLIPAIEEFSFIADPNRYKTIFIPFYRTGIIDGDVNLQPETGGLKPVSGLRLILSKPSGTMVVTLRTFSDGSFYAMDLPPGTYKLQIDPAQLEFMQVTSEPEYIDLEVKATSDGDYIENLRFLLSPKSE